MAKSKGKLAIEELLKARQRVVDPEQLLAAILKQFGGVDAYAREIHREYEAAAVGGMTRMNLHRFVSTLMTYVYTTKGAGTSVEDLDTEDLEGILRDYHAKPQK